MPEATLPPEIEWVIRQMAGREAAALLLLAPPIDGSARELFVRVARCPECAADERAVLAFPGAFPPRTASVLHPDEEPAEEGNVLTMLGCELLSVRSLLPVVLAKAAGGERVLVTTRAAALADLCSGGHAAMEDPDQRVLALERRERTGAYALGLSTSPMPAASLTLSEPRSVLPASTRLNPLVWSAGGTHRQLHASFLTTHDRGFELARRQRVYREHLVREVREGLQRYGSVSREMREAHG
jgi:hypothetical protein